MKRCKVKKKKKRQTLEKSGIGFDFHSFREKGNRQWILQRNCQTATVLHLKRYSFTKNNDKRETNKKKLTLDLKFVHLINIFMLSIFFTNRNFLINFCGYVRV